VVGLVGFSFSALHAFHPTCSNLFLYGKLPNGQGIRGQGMSYLLSPCCPRWLGLIVRRGFTFSRWNFFEAILTVLGKENLASTAGNFKPTYPHRIIGEVKCEERKT
jgi:hypothetical protein